MEKIIQGNVISNVTSYIVSFVFPVLCMLLFNSIFAPVETYQILFIMYPKNILHIFYLFITYSYIYFLFIH